MIGLKEIRLPVLPSEWEVKAYLVERYNPRTSYGMPKVVPQEEMERTIAGNMNLARFVKNYFKTKDMSEIYTIMKQMENIRLSDDYSEFSFTDGKTHEVTTYKGSLWFAGNKINSRITRKKKRKVPC